MAIDNPYFQYLGNASFVSDGMDDDDNVLGWVTHVETPSMRLLLTISTNIRRYHLGGRKPFVCLSRQMERMLEKLSSFNLHFCVFNVRYISHFVIRKLKLESFRRRTCYFMVDDDESSERRDLL